MGTRSSRPKPPDGRHVRLVAVEKEHFTTDDLWKYVERPREPRAMGAVMTRASSLGEHTMKSVRVACHARPLRIWKSLLYRPVVVQ